MNSRLLGKGMVGGLLFLIGTALCAAVPPVTKAAASTVKEIPDDSGNPYSVIVERNIFHLNPPPPPPEPEKPKVELPVVDITGFVNIGSQSKVLFRSQPKDKKEGPFYYSLAEGESGADGSHKLELVKIHPSQDGVDVINDGVVVTLTVKDNSLGATGAPAPPASKERPGFNPGSGPGGRPMFRPPGVPGMPAGFSYPSRRRNLPQR